MEVDVVTLAAEFPNDNPALHRGTIWICPALTGRAVAERAAIDGSETAADDATIIDADEPIVIEELEPVEAFVEGEGTETSEPEGPLPLAAPARVSEIVLAGTRQTEHETDEDAASLDAPSVFDMHIGDAALTPPTVRDDAAPVMAAMPSLAPPPADDPFTTLVCKLVDVAVSAGALEVAAVLPELFGNGRVSTAIGRDVGEALRAAGYWDGADVTPSFVRVAHAWRDILRGTSEDFDACGGASLDEWAADVLAKLLATPARLPLLRQELRSRGVAAFGLVEAA